ncbi:RNA-binding protein [uncultured Duncaniella sp.]|uniref:RNA-binding protein n=1 Tax=uncultured Duncaniella sp. TaxID=2768039 RepID=UPI0025AA15D5|nr:RNA-binding protein [uncultured Duncaniella sp.]
MELSVKDRLYLPTFLPARGNFKDFNLKKDILRKIAISDNERKEIGLHENAEDKRIEWDVKKERPLVVEFSTEEAEYLRKACEKISDEELPDDMWATVACVYDLVQEQ